MFLSKFIKISLNGENKTPFLYFACAGNRKTKVLM
jgi:hypothetical protein